MSRRVSILDGNEKFLSVLGLVAYLLVAGCPAYQLVVHLNKNSQS